MVISAISHPKVIYITEAKGMMVSVLVVHFFQFLLANLKDTLQANKITQRGLYIFFPLFLISCYNI